jgi:hypothetical protein
MTFVYHRGTTAILHARSLSVFSYIAAVLLALAALKVCFAACLACRALLHPTHTSADDYFARSAAFRVCTAALNEMLARSPPSRFALLH